MRQPAATLAAAVVTAVFASAAGGVAGQPANKPAPRHVPMPNTAAAVAADVQVTLTWDVDSDLDLFVIEPSGERIYYGNPTSRTGGALDLDSNAACNIDGKRVENIRWPPGDAPEGQYTVQVDEFSACRTSMSNYTVRIVNGASVQTFRGTISGGRTIEVATFERRVGDPSRPVEQTQDECLNNAGSSPSMPPNPAWDPVVGPCVRADEADVASFENLVEACRVCWLRHGDGSSQMQMSSLTTQELERILNCIIAEARQREGAITKIAGVGFVIAAIASAPATVTLGLGGFAITMTLARAAGISPVETLANGLARILGIDIGGGSGEVAGFGNYALKVQSTNPDVLGFDFATNGDLEFHFGGSEPAAFVWTLMEDETPIGSLVLPYAPLDGGACTVENLGAISGTVTRNGTLGHDCVAPNWTGELARYYSFTLAQTTDVRIDMTSSAVDAWLGLREGAGTSGSLVLADNDSGGGTNARIENSLPAGTYTIEVSTAVPGVAATGAFILTVVTVSATNRPPTAVGVPGAADARGR